MCVFAVDRCGPLPLVSNSYPGDYTTDTISDVMIYCYPGRGFSNGLTQKALRCENGTWSDIDHCKRELTIKYIRVILVIIHPHGWELSIQRYIDLGLYLSYHQLKSQIFFYTREVIVVARNSSYNLSPNRATTLQITHTCIAIGCNKSLNSNSNVP